MSPFYEFKKKKKYQGARGGGPVCSLASGFPASSVKSHSEWHVDLRPVGAIRVQFLFPCCSSDKEVSVPPQLTYHFRLARLLSVSSIKIKSAELRIERRTGKVARRREAQWWEMGVSLQLGIHLTQR